MDMHQLNIEATKEALSETNETLSDEAIENIVCYIEGNFENRELLSPTPDNPLINENKELKEELKKEQNKSICPDCNGKSYTISYGGTFQSQSKCYTCNGRGYIY